MEPVTSLDGRELWDIHAVAAHIGVQARSVAATRTAHAKGKVPDEHVFPAPAAPNGRSFYWFADEVRDWFARNPTTRTGRPPAEAADGAGAVMREARERWGFSQTEMAEALNARCGSGFDQRLVSRIELGYASVPKTQAATVAALLRRKSAPPR